MATSSKLRAFYAFSFLKNLEFFGALSVPFYLYRLKFDYSRMFILEAIFSVAMMLLEVPTGVVADRWGRKVSLLLGSLFLALAFFAFGIFRAFWVLAVAEVVCAVGMTFVSGADKAFLYEFLAAESREGEASRIFGKYEAAGTAGRFLAFPLGSLFAGSGILPYEQALGLVFVFTAVAMALSGVALLGVKESYTAPAGGGFLKHGVEGFLIIFREKSLRNFGLDYAAISALIFSCSGFISRCSQERVCLSQGTALWGVGCTSERRSSFPRRGPFRSASAHGRCCFSLPLFREFSTSRQGRSMDWPWRSSRCLGLSCSNCSARPCFLRP
jgi:MFS family permease